MNEKFNIKLPETPTKDILDAETQDYIEKRFPKTNDDNLQEDLAVKFVTDANFIDKLNKEENLSEKIEQGMNTGLWKLYEEQLKLGSYVEIHKDLNTRVSSLIDTLKVIKLKSDINKTFKLEKSDISEAEISDFYREQIDDIEKELNTIKNEEISPESVGQVFNQYSEAVDKYNNLYKILIETNPELN